MRGNNQRHSAAAESARELGEIVAKKSPLAKMMRPQRRLHPHIPAESPAEGNPRDSRVSGVCDKIVNDSLYVLQDIHYLVSNFSRL